MRWFTRRPAVPEPAADHCCVDVLAENIIQANDIDHLKAQVGRLRDKVRDLTKQLEEAQAAAYAYPTDQAPTIPRDARRLIAQKDRALLAMQERLDAAEGRPGVVRTGWRVS